MLEVAVEGSLNIFRQAEKAGIKTFVYVSTIVTFPAASLFDGEAPDVMFTYDRKRINLVPPHVTDRPRYAFRMGRGFERRHSVKGTYLQGQRS